MAYEPCRYAQRWPELFESLDDDQKQRVSDALANNRLEGWEVRGDRLMMRGKSSSRRPLRWASASGPCSRCCTAA